MIFFGRKKNNNEEQIIAEQDLHDLEILKNGLVSSASHQLRTPLTTINWYSELLIDGDIGELNDLQKDYVKQIYQSSKKMVHIVDSLLSTSMFESGQIKPTIASVDLHELISKLAEAVQTKTHREDLNIKITQAPGFDATIFSDQTLLHQILLALVDNAVAYSPEKNSSIEIELKKELDNTIISIIDHGIGIPLSEQTHIFGKFFRASNAAINNPDGVGIDLAIAKLTTEALGGEISFESKEGSGSKFTVVLPIKEKEIRTADYNDIDLLS